MSTSATAFRIGASPTDTAKSTLLLARISVTGETGGVVTPTLDTAIARRYAAGSASDFLIVRIDSLERRFSVADIAAGVEVHRFTSAGTAVLEYRLVRCAKGAQGHDVRLVQHVMGASVITAERPWGATLAAPKAMTASDPHPMQVTCSVDAPGPTRQDGVSVDIDPYVANGDDGFQSDECCGVSHTITVTFSQPVSSVTATIGDPDFETNWIVAYDSSNTIVDQKAFVGDSLPGVLTYDTKTVSGSGITSIKLIPAADEYVFYLPLQVTVGEETLHLVCSGPVERASVVTCTASPVNPADTLLVTE